MTEIFPILYTDPPFTVRYPVPPPEALTDVAALRARIEELETERENRDMWLVTACSALLQVCEAEEVLACLTESQQAAVERVRKGLSEDTAIGKGARG